MKNNITELVFILDRSGSMAGMESDCTGGFNSFIEKQKKMEGKAFVTTVLFNQDFITLHDRADIQKIKPMKKSEFQVGGCTALIDAMGESIEHTAMIHKYARPEDVPEHTMFIIMTDGLENASRRYSSDDVKKLVEQKKELGWEFIFMGANIDAVETARHYGIDEDRAVTYVNDSEGAAMNFDAACEAACCMRASAPIGRGWKRKIEDTTERKTGSKK